MQFKLAFVTAALATLAVATPARRNEPASSCTTAIQCCDTVVPATDIPAAILKELDLLGIVLQDNVLVGLTCVPISVIGVGGSGCSAEAVCCEDNSHGGLISIGCVHVDL